MNGQRLSNKQQYNLLVEEISQNMDLLNVLEDSLLQELSFCTGTILDNEDLSTTLEKTKLNAVDIKNKIDGSSVAKAHFEEARSAYKSVAARGSLLYFTSSGLSHLNSIYELLLGTFLKQFLHALDGAQQAACIKDRMCSLIECATRTIYYFTNIGIFKKQRLTYSFYLTCMILEDDGKLEKAALNLFLKGNHSIGVL